MVNKTSDPYSEIDIRERRLLRGGVSSDAPVFYERRSTHVAYRDESSGVKLSCRPHLHYHVEIAVLLEGHTTAQADSDEYELSAGDLFISFPNQVHRFISYGSEKYRILILNPELFPEFDELLITNVPRESVIRGFAEDDISMQLIEMIGRTAGDWDHGKYTNSAITSLCSALLARILPRLALDVFHAGDSRALREIVKFCYANYTNDMSLATVEQNLHLSKYYISHLFSSKIGMSFCDYINSLRVSHACKLLRGGDMSVTEIATEVGFNNLRTFSRAFAKFKNMSPGEYRRLRRQTLIPSEKPQGGGEGA